HLAHAVAALHDLGALHALASPSTAAELAERHGLAPNLLGPVLEFVAARTDLVDRDGEAFAATDRYDIHARFRLDQYLFVYGANARALAGLLRDPGPAPALVDRARHARAYAELGLPGFGLVVDIVGQLGLN